MTEYSDRWQGKSQQASMPLTLNTNWCCTATTDPSVLNSYTQLVPSPSTSCAPLSTYSAARRHHSSGSIDTTKNACLWKMLSRWMSVIAQYLTTCIARPRQRWTNGRRQGSIHTTKTYSCYGSNWETRSSSIATQAFHTVQSATRLTYAGND